MSKRKRTNNDLQDTTQKNEREEHEPQSPFVFFHVAIVLSVLLRYTDSDYPFSIFKLFLCKNMSNTKQIVILHTRTLMIGGQVIIRTLLIGFHWHSPKILQFLYILFATLQCTKILSNGLVTRNAFCALNLISVKVCITITGSIPLLVGY
jgi:hypothetical protein